MTSFTVHRPHMMGGWMDGWTDGQSEQGTKFHQSYSISMNFLQPNAPKQRTSCNFTQKSPFLDKCTVLFRVDIVISVYIILSINVSCTKKNHLFTYLTVILKIK